MAVYSIDAETFVRMFVSGANQLEADKDWVNELNVFPVPDGDTGTNMTMTLSTAVKEVEKLDGSATLEQVAKAISFGSLRGARGNSGVILSQLLRGFCKVLQNQETLDAWGIAEAVSKAVETAYKAVMKPKEGTILTVARGLADKWCTLAEDRNELELLMEDTLAEGDTVLKHTPDLLPVLKEAGVVDSGGQGLMVFLRGCQAALLGHPVASAVKKEEKAPAAVKIPAQSGPISTDDIKFGYCTEFLVNLPKPLTEAEEKEFKSYLECLGDSLVLVAVDEIVKVHVHTNDPGLAIQKALSYGSLTNMKIDNMRVEHEEKLIRNASAIAAEEKAAKESAEEPAEEDTSSWKEYGIVATAVGSGLKEILLSIGVDAIVEGGQTMNPSAEDILEAVRRVKAKNVFVLPNNGNIILAAGQAKQMEEQRNIIVIPSKSVPQGITAVANFMAELSPEENTANMTAALSAVKDGEVTYAVRDTSIGGHTIHEKDIIALGGPEGIYAVGTDISEVVLEMIGRMADEDSGLISLYYGEDVAEQDAEALREKLCAAYPDCDVEVLSGGQPVYYYIGSVE